MLICAAAKFPRSCQNSETEKWRGAVLTGSQPWKSLDVPRTSARTQGAPPPRPHQQRLDAVRPCGRELEPLCSEGFRFHVFAKKKDGHLGSYGNDNIIYNTNIYSNVIGNFARAFFHNLVTSGSHLPKSYCLSTWPVCWWLPQHRLQSCSGHAAPAFVNPIAHSLLVLYTRLFHVYPKYLIYESKSISFNHI